MRKGYKLDGSLVAHSLLQCVVLQPLFAFLHTSFKPHLCLQSPVNNASFLAFAMPGLSCPSFPLLLCPLPALHCTLCPTSHPQASSFSCVPCWHGCLSQRVLPRNLPRSYRSTMRGTGLCARPWRRCDARTSASGEFWVGWVFQGEAGSGKGMKKLGREGWGLRCVWDALCLPTCITARLGRGAQGGWDRRGGCAGGRR